MKKTMLIFAFLASSLTFANNNSLQKEIFRIVNDDCQSLYKATKEIAKSEGFSDGAAQAIAAAALNTCKGKTKQKSLTTK